jgi:uncharacterized damage-inducible protein DinB
MKEFLLDKFEYDFYATKQLIEFIEKQEDSVSDFVKKSISHIINVGHIWNARIVGRKPESELWDRLPIYFLNQLHNQNYREILDYIENVELGEKVKYHSSEGIRLDKEDLDILFHLLTHSNYHRAQIVMDLKQNGLNYPSLNFIAYKN